MAVGLGACAAPVAEKAKPESAQAPTAPAPPVSTAVAAAPAAAPTPAAPAPDPRAPLVARHREQAQALEREGDLQRALLEWKVALTIDPADAAARAGRASVEGRIERGAAEKIEAAKAALARGVQVEARRQLLAALALDPANKTAFQMLQTQAREVDFVTHTVRAGDTLASLAQRYYGDRSRSEVIWETNQLPPNPRLVAGATLKIPEIPGVPFVHPEARRAAPAVPAPSAPSPPRAAESPKDEPAVPEVHPLLADAREALERNDYAEALSEVDKYLASSPGNRDGLAVKKQALYKQGKAQLSDRKYEESYRALTQLVKLQPDYEDSPALLQQARTQAIEQHYSQGVRLYREEKLNDAIAEWRVVLEMDPQHVNARRNIDQAEKLLKALEEKKKR
jgi:tetratricopeptide (TPR) repeat protein